MSDVSPQYFMTNDLAGRLTRGFASLLVALFQMIIMGKKPKIESNIVREV